MRKLGVCLWCRADAGGLRLTSSTPPTSVARTDTLSYDRRADRHARHRDEWRERSATIPLAVSVSGNTSVTIKARHGSVDVLLQRRHTYPLIGHMAIHGDERRAGRIRTRPAGHHSRRAIRRRSPFRRRACTPSPASSILRCSNCHSHGTATHPRRGGGARTRHRSSTSAPMRRRSSKNQGSSWRPRPRQRWSAARLRVATIASACASRWSSCAWTVTPPAIPRGRPRAMIPSGS